jgi:hypothetical protein
MAWSVSAAVWKRARYDDVMAYDARAKVLDQLTAEAQELATGY